MKLSLKLEKEIKKAYSDLNEIGIISRIYIKLENNMVLDYPVFNDLVMRDMSEDDSLLMEERIKVVIKINSLHLLAYTAQNTEFPCINKEMKKIIGGKVTWYWQDNVNAILERNEGAYCFGTTLPKVVKCCKVLENTIKEYIKHY